MEAKEIAAIHEFQITSMEMEELLTKIQYKNENRNKESMQHSLKQNEIFLDSLDKNK